MNMDNANVLAAVQGTLAVRTSQCRVLQTSPKVGIGRSGSRCDMRSPRISTPVMNPSGRVTARVC